MAGSRTLNATISVTPSRQVCHSFRSLIIMIIIIIKKRTCSNGTGNGPGDPSSYGNFRDKRSIIISPGRKLAIYESRPRAREATTTGLTANSIHAGRNNTQRADSCRRSMHAWQPDFACLISSTLSMSAFPPGLSALPSGASSKDNGSFVFG